jgi:hypothetical protein
VVDGQILGDAQKPGPKGKPSFLIASDGLKGLEERLRSQVFSQLPIADQAMDVSVGKCSVAIVQFAESLTVSGFCPFDEDNLHRRRGSRVRHR